LTVILNVCNILYSLDWTFGVIHVMVLNVELLHTILYVCIFVINVTILSDKILLNPLPLNTIVVLPCVDPTFGVTLLINKSILIFVQLVKQLSFTLLLPILGSLIIG